MTTNLDFGLQDIGHAKVKARRFGALSLLLVILYFLVVVALWMWSSRQLENAQTQLSAAKAERLQVRSQTAAARKDLADLKQQKKDLLEAIKAKEKTIAGYNTILQHVNQNSLKAAADQSKPDLVPPRLYIQLPKEDDKAREAANKVAAELRSQGFLVPEFDSPAGVENVKGCELRFAQEKVSQEDLQKIRGVLAKEMPWKVSDSPLSGKFAKRTRPKTFELWIGPESSGGWQSEEQGPKSTRG